MKGPVRIKIVASIIKKEFPQVLRDKRMRLVLFVAPIMMMVVFGYAVNTDVSDIRLAVLDEDRTAMSRGLVEKLTSSGYFRLQSYLESAKELDRLMDSNEVEAYLHIERGLSKRVKSESGISFLQVIINGTDSNRAMTMFSYMNEAMQGFFIEKYFSRIRTTVLYRTLAQGPEAAEAVSGMKLSRGVRITERVFFNPVLSSRNFFLPGIIAMIVSLITIMLTSMSIVKERESGTMEQIIVSPIRPLEFIMGKTVPFAIIGCVDMLLISIVSIFWFGVPFQGNILFLFLAGIFYILCSLSVGMFISTISRTQQQAMMSFFMYFIPAIMFSGFVFPVYSMPEVIQYMVYLNPLMYFITIIRGVFLKGVGIAVLWKELLVLVCIGTALMYLSVRRLRRRIE